MEEKHNLFCRIHSIISVKILIKYENSLKYLHQSCARKLDIFVVGVKTINRVALWLESKLGKWLSPLLKYHMIIYLGTVLPLTKGFRELKEKKSREGRKESKKVTEFQLSSLEPLHLLNHF